MGQGTDKFDNAAQADLQGQAPAASGPGKGRDAMQAEDAMATVEGMHPARAKETEDAVEAIEPVESRLEDAPLAGGGLMPGRQAGQPVESGAPGWMGPTAANLQPVLLVSSLTAVQGCAEQIARALQCDVEVAESRKSAMQMLRRKEYRAVVVDDAVAESDAEAAEQLWRAAALAVPLQVNFAISSATRVTRELRAALYRRTLEEVRARKAAENNLQADIGSALTGIVLELDLLRTADDIPAYFRDRLAQVSALTADLRKKLTPTLPQRAMVEAAKGSIKVGLRASAARSALHKQVAAAREGGVSAGPEAATESRLPGE
jgi:hypothetical protein